ncbi:MAG: YigZ family protein [Ferruginibacter sp.]
MEYYYTIENESVAEYKDRGSTFIAFAYPIKYAADFKPILAELKKLHPKAVHHCFAYRIGLTGDVFRVSDDGEPSGTAGRPILGQIDSKNLTNVCIIVVRYFGGTLLGVPGLIKAYKTVSSLALQTVPTIQKQRETEVLINFEYAQTNEVLSILKNYNATIIEQELHLFPFIKASIPAIRMEEIISKMKSLSNVEFKNLV